MKQFTINVDEKKVKFFVELMHSLDFVNIESGFEYELSEDHIRVLEDRLEAYNKNPDDLLDWEDVKKEIEGNL